LGTIAIYEEREADNLIYSLQNCFSVKEHAAFHATYLTFRDIFIPQAKREYEQLHDQFMRRFGVESKN
jgi:hypothetical protein